MQNFTSLPLLQKFDSLSLYDLQQVARKLAGICKAGRVIALWGNLGVGKTTFARSLIKTLVPDAAEIPSPTFALVQTYCTGLFDVWHFDLYRLHHPEEALELSIEEAWHNSLVLIEWPERLGHLLPDDRLDVRIDFAKLPNHRQVQICGSRAWDDQLLTLGTKPW